MSIIRAFLNNISKHYAFSHFFNQKNENRLLISAIVNFAFVAVLYTFNQFMDKIHHQHYSDMYEQPVIEQSTQYSIADFMQHLHDNDVDNASVAQMIDFIKDNNIINIHINQQNNKYDLFSHHDRFTLKYTHRGWFFDNNQSIQYKILNRDFFDNVKIDSFFGNEKYNESDAKFRVVSPHGLSITALDDCNVSIDGNRIVISYPYTYIGNHKIFIEIKIHGNQHNAQLAKYAFNRGEEVIHIAQGQKFTLRLIQKNNGDYVAHDPFTTNVYSINECSEEQ